MMWANGGAKVWLKGTMLWAKGGVPTLDVEAVDALGVPAAKRPHQITTNLVPSILYGSPNKKQICAGVRTPPAASLT